MSVTLKNAILCFLLAGFPLFVYFAKMKYEQPSTGIIFAWRLFFFGGTSVFVTVGLLVLGVGDIFDGSLRKILIDVMFAEMLITFIGLILSFIESSTTKQ